jgi:hypothetical protein
MRVTGRCLAEELLELLPDYELAWTDQEPAGDERAEGALPGGGGCGFSAYYRTASTAALSGRYGDLLHRLRDLEVGRGTRARNVAAAGCLVSGRLACWLPSLPVLC